MNKNKVQYERVVKEVVDINTGEVKRVYEEKLPELDGYEIKYLPQRKKLPDNGRYIILWQDVVLNIVKNLPLSKNELTILLYLLAVAEQNNTIMTRNIAIAEDCHLQDTNVCTALKNLQKYGIIEQRKLGQTKIITLLNFTLNPELAYNGKWERTAYNKAKFASTYIRDATGANLLPEDTERHRKALEQRLGPELPFGFDQYE